MSIQPSPLVFVAQSYINENCSSSDKEQQDLALEIIESYIKGNITYEEALQQFSSVVKNTAPLDKIRNILAVDEEPLPAQPEADNQPAINSLSAQSRKRKLNPWDQVEDNRLLAGIHRYGLEN